MEVLHWLPIELKFEVLIHLDCTTLVRVLTLYRSLQERVIIIPDTTERYGALTNKKPSISTLLPGVRCVALDDIPSGVPPHCYLKIFELASDIQNSDQLCSWDDDFGRSFCYNVRPTYGITMRDTYGRNNLAAYYGVWPKLLAVMDRYSVLTCSAGGLGFDFIKGWLLQLSSNTGATYHPMFPLLDAMPDTQLPRRRARPSKAISPFSIWASLTTIKTTVESEFLLESTFRVRTLSVEFTTTAQACTPALVIGAGPCLETLQVLYHGERVPQFSVSNCFPGSHHPILMSDYDSQYPVSLGLVRWMVFYYRVVFAFELTRLHPESSLMATTDTSRRSRYNSDLSFTSRCSHISLSGVPDWFAMKCGYDCATNFHWFRTDPTILGSKRVVPRLHMPCIETIHICSMISDDNLPLILERKGSPSRTCGLLTLNITACAPGLNVKRLLSSFGWIECLIIRTCPRPTHSLSLIPYVYLTQDILNNISGQRKLVLDGNIDLRGVLSTETNKAADGRDHYRYDGWRDADIDLTTTARLSRNNAIDLRYIPFGYLSGSFHVKLTCSADQPLILSLHKTLSHQISSTPLRKHICEDGTPRFLIAHSTIMVPELLLNWHMVQSTSFDGEKIVDVDFHQQWQEWSGRLEYAHFLFDGATQKYIFCDICTACVTRLSN